VKKPPLVSFKMISGWMEREPNLVATLTSKYMQDIEYMQDQVLRIAIRQQDKKQVAPKGDENDAPTTEASNPGIFDDEKVIQQLYASSTYVETLYDYISIH